ncbi:MAG TPA: TIGR02466 family protein [Caulobacteraceae bacterium]|nr:TIGR02466 family protein [Caulobacteraceae bacterium]
MTTRTLFVTRLYEAPLGGPADLNDELEDACRMLEAQDRAGQAWAREHAYRGYTSYASLDDLPKRVSAFGELKRRLDKHAATFARDLHLDLGGRRLVLDSLWVNVLRPGGAHSGHIHPHSVLSGTYYVTVAPGASRIRFEDPRLAMMMAAPPRSTEAPEEERQFVYVEPTPGSLLLWESWLRHEVPANGSKADRISISFNYSWR